MYLVKHFNQLLRNIARLTLVRDFSWGVGHLKVLTAGSL